MQIIEYFHHKLNANELITNFLYCIVSIACCIDKICETNVVFLSFNKTDVPENFNQNEKDTAKV